MGRGNAHGDATALASRSSLRCLIKEERDLLALHEALSRRPDQYLHAGAVEWTLPLDELAAQCVRSFLASASGSGSEPFRPEEKEQVGQALYAVAVLEGEPVVDLLAAIDADLARARRDFIPDEEEVEELVRDSLLEEESLDERDLEDAIADRGELYLEARERAIEELCDKDVAPAQELSNYIYDLWHALGANPNVLRDRLPSPGEAWALRQEADRARAELPLAA